MNIANDTKKSVRLFFSELSSGLIPVLKSRYFYMSVAILISGIGLSLLSQIYLHNIMTRGTMFPMLSDLVLDRIPVVDVTLVYDLLCIVVYGIVIIYIIHRKKYGRIPVFLLMAGIFYAIRAVFVVLTPLGNPPDFNGSDPLFNGFMKYELGVYPSGHVGNSFLLLLLVNDRIYKYILGLCLLIIVLTLILAHCHYSIDILSGFFFAYAIKAFGDKYLKMFVLKTELPG